MEDDRQATTPDYRFSRMEFLVVGMVNEWVVVPVDAPKPFPHGADVILSAVRVEAQQEDGTVRFGEYLQADRVFILQPVGR